MPTLGIIMVVRDEADIIEQNLRFHYSQGVDHFAVMNNLSKDGTGDILESLSAELPISIFSQPSSEFRQDLWANQLAKCLIDRGIDWATSIDADEFISGSDAPLRTIVDGLACPVCCIRQNMLPLDTDRPMLSANPLAPARYRVANPLPSRLPILLRRMPGKMLFPLRGLRSIARGNHHIAHDIAERAESDRILIRHFPVRSLDRFLTKLDFARERFRQERNVSPNTSWHLRRWLDIQDHQDIEEEYESFFVSLEDSIKFLNDQTIVEDPFAQRLN